MLSRIIVVSWRRGAGCCWVRVGTRAHAAWNFHRSDVCSFSSLFLHMLDSVSLLVEIKAARGSGRRFGASTSTSGSVREIGHHGQPSSAAAADCDFSHLSGDGWLGRGPSRLLQPYQIYDGVESDGNGKFGVDIVAIYVSGGQRPEEQSPYSTLTNPPPASKPAARATRQSCRKARPRPAPMSYPN